MPKKEAHQAAAKGKNQRYEPAGGMWDAEIVKKIGVAEVSRELADTRTGQSVVGRRQHPVKPGRVIA